MPRTPWMKWNPAEYRDDPQVRLLTRMQDLLYRRALEVTWSGNGTLPADLDSIRILTDWPSEEFDSDWSKVAKFFMPHPDDPDKLTNKRILSDHADAIARQEQRSAAGRSRANAAKRDSDGKFTSEPSDSLDRSRQRPVASGDPSEETSDVAGLRASGYGSSSSSLNSKKNGQAVAEPKFDRGVRKALDRIPDETPGFKAFYDGVAPEGSGIEIPSGYRGYPRRMKRRDAAKAYRKLLREAVENKRSRASPVTWRDCDGPLAEFLMDRVLVHCSFPPGTGLNCDPKYQPYPATWLNSGSFDDEPEG